jgi:uncharacterized LabA/DUF88 family protein
MTTLHAFVDGGYLQVMAKSLGCVGWQDPSYFVRQVCEQINGDYRRSGLKRITYYDGLPDEPVDEERLRCWTAIEQTPNVHLGFGFVRGRKGKMPRQQKAVDTLLSVDMLVGAFNGIFGNALLVAGDADFVPAVQEVQRRGVHVCVVASPTNLSPELRWAADRVFEILSHKKVDYFKALHIPDNLHLPEEYKAMMERDGT